MIPKLSADWGYEAGNAILVCVLVYLFQLVLDFLLASFWSDSMPEQAL